MDFEDIDFTEWQIDKIRLALNKYRVARAKGSRLLSWTEVRDDITGCDENRHQYPSEEEAEDIFKAEVLRRFAAELSLPKPERLADIARFLLYERILSLRDLDESMSELGELLSLHQYLANNTDDAKAFLEDLAGTYVVTKDSGRSSSKTLILRLAPDPTYEFLRVEELHQSSAGQAGSEIEINTTRIGYGFAVTPLNILHIFLNGVVPESRITYVQAGELCDNSPRSGIFLMRNGEATGRNAIPSDVFTKEPAFLPNIYRFSPVKADGGL